VADESLIGLLLRAHAQCAAQAHGEQFVHNNIPAMCDFETAKQSIEGAIKSVMFAEQQVRIHEATVTAEKAKKRR